MDTLPIADFKLQTNTIFGPNSLEGLVPFVKQRGYRRVAIVIDSNVDGSAYWQTFKPRLEEACALETYYRNGRMEPTYDDLEEIRGQFSASLDCIIGVGGGSTLDIAKAVSVLATNPDRAIAYRGYGLIKNSGVPLILIPSTAGSGSEVTPFAVFIETREQRKFGINSPLYLPVLTILDPCLTLSCPKSVTIASGIDALTHTLESFVARKHTVISRLFSTHAFGLLYNNLPRVLVDPTNLDLRTELSLGAYYAGIALLNSAAGPAGALSYPIGTFFNVTHGLAGAPFLLPVVAFNIAHGYRDYEILDELIEGSRVTRYKSRHFLEHLTRFCDELEIPKDLGVFGATRADIPRILEQLRLLWFAVEQNPISMTEADVQALLEDVIPSESPTRSLVAQ